MLTIQLPSFEERICDLFSNYQLVVTGGSGIMNSPSHGQIIIVS